MEIQLQKSMLHHLLSSSKRLSSLSVQEKSFEIHKSETSPANSDKNVIDIMLFLKNLELSMSIGFTLASVKRKKKLSYLKRKIESKSSKNIVCPGSLN